MMRAAVGSRAVKEPADGRREEEAKDDKDAKEAHQKAQRLPLELSLLGWRVNQTKRGTTRPNKSKDFPVGIVAFSLCKGGGSTGPGGAPQGDPN